MLTVMSIWPVENASLQAVSPAALKPDGAQTEEEGWETTEFSGLFDDKTSDAGVTDRSS